MDFFFLTAVKKATPVRRLLHDIQNEACVGILKTGTSTCKAMVLIATNTVF